MFSRSLQLGTPPSHNLDTISLAKSSEDAIEVPTSNSTLPCRMRFNAYDCFIELTILKGEIYNKLYTIKAWEMNDADVIATVSTLDSMLKDWTNTLPEEYIPGHISANEIVERDPYLTLLYLHFSYYNCLLSVHRRSVTRASWSIDLDPRRYREPFFRPSGARPFESTQICATAARASLELSLWVPKNHPICGG